MGDEGPLEVTISHPNHRSADSNTDILLRDILAWTNPLSLLEDYIRNGCRAIQKLEKQAPGQQDYTALLLLQPIHDSTIQKELSKVSSPKFLRSQASTMSLH